MRIKHTEGGETLPAVIWDTVLASAENYVDFLIARFGEEHVDREIDARA